MKPPTKSAKGNRPNFCLNASISDTYCHLKQLRKMEKYSVAKLFTIQMIKNYLLIVFVHEHVFSLGTGASVYKSVLVVFMRLQIC